MPIVEVPYKGTAIMQVDAPHPSFEAGKTEGVIFKTEDGIHKVPSGFTNTCHPLGTNNTSWISVKIDWERSTSSSPADFSGTFSLYGLPLIGSEDLIAEEYITTCSSPGPTTESVIFDLKGSGGIAPAHKTGSTASAGSIRLNLPMLSERYYGVSIGVPWLSDWSKRKSITIMGSPDGALTDFPVEFVVDYDADMNADFSDLRFTGADGQSGMCYWIKKKVDSSYAWVVLKATSVPVSPRTVPVFMYYGNASATPVSNIAAVSYIYDDFTTYDTDKWQFDGSSGSSISSDGDVLTIVCPSTNVTPSQLISKTATISYSHTIMETRCKVTPLPNNSYYKFGGLLYKMNNTRPMFTGTSGYGHFLVEHRYSATTPFISHNQYAGGSVGAWDVVKNTYTADDYKILRAEIHDGVGATYKTYDDTTPVSGSLVNTDAPTTPYTCGTPYYVGLNTRRVTATYDWISVRQSTATPPTVTVGSVELATPLTYVTPTTTGTQYMEFTTPSYWTDNSQIFFEVEEYEQTPYYTKPLSVAAGNVLNLKYDGVDRYVGLRVKYEGYHNDEYDVKITGITYSYEV